MENLINMKTATIDEKTYQTTKEIHAGLCHSCAGNQRTEESDILCKKLSLEVDNDCEDLIWKEA